MSQSWITILGLMGATLLLRSAGPLLLGHRQLPAWSIPVLDALPIALMVAMIVVQTVADGSRVVIDQRLVGLGAAAGVLAFDRNRLLPAVFAAAIAVALLRLVN